MRAIKRLGQLTALGCALLTGCDRDSAPRQVDRLAPAFSLNDGEHTVDLTKLRGKVVVLNFWASWCAPCIEEMPSLEQLHHELPQVDIIAVASDEEFSAYRSYVLQHRIDLTTVFDQDQTSNALYGSFRFPETYIIDKQGFVRRKLIGPQDFTSPDFMNYLRELAS
jgi:cytochrome c biogenesis protein CcmG/thiol:disulfide interchange protein DsbE